MKASKVTMSMTLDGYAIQETLGVVRGIVVRSRSVFGSIGARLQTIVGGNISLLTSLCERTRADAFAQMIEHAELLGADGVICVRYDATEVMPGVTEVLCYATAVRTNSER
ncbi:MAG: YbjQ family protein [Gemmatimonadaceae bacterium]